MSNSVTLLDQISSTQATKEVVANALFDSASPAMLWGRRASTTAGLTWGYYGGTYCTASSMNTVANGTLTLTASATNYLYASATTGAVSVNTTGFPAGAIPLYQIVTSSTAVTSYTDVRSYQPSAIGGSITSESSEGTGVSLIDTANSTPQVIKIKTLVGSGAVTITDNGASGIQIGVASGSGAAGTVTGAANEGSGVGLFDSANSTAATLKFKTLVQGAGATITDNGSAGVNIALSASAGGNVITVENNGASVVTPTNILNFTGNVSVAASGTTANIGISTNSGVADTIPQLSGYTQSMQGSATAAQQAWGIQLNSPSNASDLASTLLKAVPAAPYAIVARMRAVPLTTTAGAVMGLAWSDGTKVQVAGMSTSGNFIIGNYNSSTSWSGYQSNSIAFRVPPEWWRIRDDGTNRYLDISPDGSTWVNLYSISRTAFLTPTQVGFAIDPDAQAVYMTIFSVTGL